MILIKKSIPREGGIFMYRSRIVLAIMAFLLFIPALNGFRR